MKILYFDLFSGVSGDMILGALFDLGLEVAEVQEAVNSCLPAPVFVETSRVNSCGLSAVALKISDPGARTYVHLPEIEDFLQNSTLSQFESALALRVFRRLAEAEARIHGIPVEKIHFHELGAVDTLVDIVGCVIGLSRLGVDICASSPMPLARGMAPMSHGNYPLPAPAVLELLKDVPTVGIEADIELVTPTGAAIISTVCSSFGGFPSMTVINTGYGAGSNRREHVPNVVRAVLGENQANGQEMVGVIEANIDDMNPEFFSFLFTDFFSRPGALDITATPMVGKKNRPSFQLQCLVRPETMTDFVEFVLNNTTTLGVRQRLETRTCSLRKIIEVATPWGVARAKTWTTPNGSVRIAPEYESCAGIARKAGVAVIDVYRAVQGSGENTE